MDNSIKGNCRTCDFFHRVKKNSCYKNIMNISGFCRLGKLDGDWSLYCSSSISGKCPAYCFNQYNKDTYDKECELNKLIQDYRWNMMDKRKKEYRELKKHFFDDESIIKILDLDNQEAKWTAYMMNERMKHVVYDFLVKKYGEHYDWLNDRNTISEHFYFECLHFITSCFKDFVVKDGLDETVDVIIHHNAIGYQ